MSNSFAFLIFLIIVIRNRFLWPCFNRMILLLLVSSTRWYLGYSYEAQPFKSDKPLLTEAVFLDVFLGKRVLKIWIKCTGKRSCQSVISLKLLCNFIEITFWHGCSPINLLHIYRTSFYKNGYGGLYLYLNIST